MHVARRCWSAAGPDKAVALPEGSWGDGGDHRVWVNERVRWMWEIEYRCETIFGKLTFTLPWRQRADLRALLETAGRELLLLQASDWIFIIARDQAVDYGIKRIIQHADRFESVAALAGRIATEGGSVDRLSELEQWEMRDAVVHDVVFPRIDLELVERVTQGAAMETRDRLNELARNFYWTWKPDFDHIFNDLDPKQWKNLNRNPIALMRALPDDYIDAQLRTTAIGAGVTRSYYTLRDYLEQENTWGSHYVRSLRVNPVAYFSAEFGLHGSLPIYSGGLGVLAGDHLKAASDLDVPIVGVGMLYAQGYFRQSLDATGWQQEQYSDIDLAELPLEPARNVDGEPLRVIVEGAPNERIHVAGVDGTRRAARDSSCSIPTSTGTRRRCAGSPPTSTAATTACASGRSWCSAWADCARCTRWAFAPACCT